jgi:hypothetical protein
MGTSLGASEPDRLPTSPILTVPDVPLLLVELVFAVPDPLLLLLLLHAASASDAISAAESQAAGWRKRLATA